MDQSSGPRLRIVQGVTGDALTLAPGESRTLDPLYLGFGDANSMTGESDAWSRCCCLLSGSLRFG